MKNTGELKIYLLWFSSTLWREQFALKFSAQNIWKENITKYLLFLQVFSSRTFTWALRHSNPYSLHVIKFNSSGKYECDVNYIR